MFEVVINFQVVVAIRVVVVIRIGARKLKAGWLAFHVVCLHGDQEGLQLNRSFALQDILLLSAAVILGEAFPVAPDVFCFIDIRPLQLL